MPNISGYISDTDAARLLAVTGKTDLHEAVAVVLNRAVKAPAKRKAAPKAKKATKTSPKAKKPAKAARKASGSDFATRMAKARAAAAKKRRK